jgi:RNA polymerase sigma-70 factor, ECF subfamily
VATGLNVRRDLGVSIVREGMNPPRSSGTQPDLALINRWKAGDQRAASEIVSSHAEALARFAVSSGEREDIEELVQDTFVRAFGSLDAFRGDSSLRSWLFTIERRLMLDRRRAERRNRGMVALTEASAGTEYDALDGLLAEEVGDRLRRAVEELSPMQKQVFSLRVVEGLSYKEIAELVGSSEGAARVHYHNAMKAVKECLHD